MRRLVFAAAALYPMMLHAQANSPAQPQTSAKSSVLESKLTPLARPADSTIPATPTRRISTGVEFPKLVQTAQIQEKTNWHWMATESERTAVVKMVVDANGTPTNLQVVQGLGPLMDTDLLAAVSQYRFRPGTLNHQPVAIELNLTLTIQSRLQ